MKTGFYKILIIHIILIMVALLVAYLHIMSVWDENRINYKTLIKHEKVLVYELHNGNKYEILAATDTMNFQEMKYYYDQDRISKGIPINFPFKIITTTSEWYLIKYYSDSTIAELKRINSFINEERYSTQTIWVDARHIHHQE